MSWKKRIVLLILAVLLIGGTWFGYALYRFLNYSLPGMYAIWHVADMITLHLDMNDGRWPANWENLREAYEVVAGRSGPNFTFDQLRELVDVDFTAVPAELAQASRIGDEPPFRVIRRHDGSGGHWSGREPNTMVWEYLREKAARPESYEPPSRPDPAERQARAALLGSRASFEVNRAGHVWRVNMGSPVNSPVFFDKDLEPLGQLHHIQELLLGYSAVTDEGMKVVGSLPELRELHLYGTRVTDAGLSQLTGLEELRTLVLGSPQFTDRAVDHLIKLKGLRFLNMNGTQVTDIGIARLRVMSQLGELQIHQTKVSDAAVKNLRTALPDLIVSRESNR